MSLFSINYLRVLYWDVKVRVGDRLRLEIRVLLNFGHSHPLKY